MARAAAKPIDLVKAAIKTCEEVLGNTPPEPEAELLQRARDAVRKEQPDNDLLAAGLAALAGAFLHATVAMDLSSLKMQTEAAFKISKASLAALKKGGGPEAAQAAALQTMAIVHLSRSEVEKAFRAASESKELCRASQDKLGEAAALQVLSEVSLGRAQRVTGGDRVDLQQLPPEKLAQFQELQQKHVDEACDALKEVAMIMHESEETLKEAKTTFRIAEIWFTGGDSSEARCFAREAVVLFKLAGSPQGQADAFRMIYNTYIQESNNAEAIKTALAMDAMWKKAGKKGEQARARLLALNLRKLSKEISLLQDDCDEIIALFNADRDYQGQATVHHTMLMGYMAAAEGHHKALQKLIREKLAGDDISEEKTALEELWAKAMKGALAAANRMLDVSFNTTEKTLRGWALASVAQVKLELFFKPYEELREEVKLFRASRGGNGNWEPLMEKVNMEEHTEALNMLTEALEIFEKAGDEHARTAVLATMQAADERAAQAEDPTETVVVLDAETKKVLEKVDRWEPATGPAAAAITA